MHFLDAAVGVSDVMICYAYDLCIVLAPSPSELPKAFCYLQACCAFLQAVMFVVTHFTSTDLNKLWTSSSAKSFKSVIATN